MRRSKKLLVADVAVPMRDGTRLAADLVTTDDGVPRPVMLVRTPYGRAATRAGHDPVALARGGWAVVVQDVRGRWDSEGTFDPFHQERADGFDTVEWCARQPWSDGRVVMTGGSYVGATQMLAASARPPSLKAISPTITADRYDDGWTYEGGALNHGLVTPWALSFVLSAKLPKRVLRKATDLARDWPAFLGLPLDERHPLVEWFPPFRHWIEGGRSPYWRDVDVSRRHRRMDVPAYHVAGWYDIFCEGSIRNYTGLAANAATDYARAGQRLVIGPWTHTGLYLETTAEMMFGLEANGIGEGVPAAMLDFLRDAADGKELESGVRLYVMGAKEWRDYTSWPPPSEPVRLHLDADAGANGLRGDGRLTREPGAGGRDVYAFDPADPVPTRGGRVMGPFLPLPGPIDQRPAEERPDVLVYTSEPLTRDLTIVGGVTATIAFASDKPSADVCVKLVDVHPDGRAYNVVDSVRRVALTPGRTRTVQVDVGSTAMCFRAGHRIRVDVSSSNFPHFDRNPAGAATQTVVRGGRSYVTLPVV